MSVMPCFRVEFAVDFLFPDYLALLLVLLLVTHFNLLCSPLFVCIVKLAHVFILV